MSRIECPISMAEFDACFTLLTGRAVGTSMMHGAFNLMVDVGKQRGGLQPLDTVRLVKVPHVCVVSRSPDGLVTELFVIANGYQPLADPSFEAEVRAAFKNVVGGILQRVQEEERKCVAHRAAVRGDSALSTTLEEIAALVAPVSCRAGIIADVKQLIADPEGWVTAHPQLRGLSSQLGWAALVEACAHHGAVAIVDPRSPGDELRDAVRRVLEAAGVVGGAISEAVRDESSATANMAAVKKALEPSQLMVVNLFPSGDTFYVACIDRTRLAGLKKLVKRADGELSLAFTA